MGLHPRRVGCLIGVCGLVLPLFSGSASADPPPSPTSCNAPDLQTGYAGNPTTAHREIQIALVLRRVKQTCPTGYVSLRATRSNGTAFEGDIEVIHEPSVTGTATREAPDQDLCRVKKVRSYLEVGTTARAARAMGYCELAELTIVYAPKKYARATRQPEYACGFLGVFAPIKSRAAHATREVLTVKVQTTDDGQGTANLDDVVTVSRRGGGKIIVLQESPDSVVDPVSPPANLVKTCQAK